MCRPQSCCSAYSCRHHGTGRAALPHGQTARGTHMTARSLVQQRAQPACNAAGRLCRKPTALPPGSAAAQSSQVLANCTCASACCPSMCVPIAAGRRLNDTGSPGSSSPSDTTCQRHTAQHNTAHSISTSNTLRAPPPPNIWVQVPTRLVCHLCLALKSISSGHTCGHRVLSSLTDLIPGPHPTGALNILKTTKK